ncbi:MAG: ATP-binding protein [Leptolyngbyaceae cyanobacterium]
MLNSQAAPTPFVVTIDLSAVSESELPDVLVTIPRTGRTAFLVLQPSLSVDITELRSLLERHTQMPVVDATSGMTLRPCTVFMIPAHQDAVIREGTLRLIPSDISDYPADNIEQEVGNQQIDAVVPLGNDPSVVHPPQSARDRPFVAETLRQSEARYHRLYHKTPVMLHTIDASGTLMRVSDYWLRKLGYNRSEVLGRPFTDFLSTASADHVATVLLPQCAELEVCIDVPYQMVCKNGTVLDILLSAIAERNAAGAFAQLLSVIVDVTELQRAQQELSDRAAALARSNSDLEQFAYVVSHDLQEPLRAMTLFSELLQQCYGSQLDESAKTYIQHIVDGGIRMQGMIDGILAFSRISYRQQTVKDVDVTMIVETATKLLATTIAETNATITYDALPIVTADHNQILQLFQNLISNALKFHGSDSPQIHITAQCRSDSWQFNVQDNGIGIPVDRQSRIFTLFQQLYDHPTAQGNGIGLAICKKIVERHQGRIWLDSVPGEGTCFHFTLATTRAAAVDEESDSTVVTPP